MDVVYVFIGITVLSVCFYMALTVGVWIDKAESQSSKLSGLSDDDLLAEVDAKMENLRVQQARKKLLDEELAVEISNQTHWKDEAEFICLSIYLVRHEKKIKESPYPISMERLFSSSPDRLRLYQAWKFECDSRELEKDRLNGNIDKWVAEAFGSSSKQE